MRAKKSDRFLGETLWKSGPERDFSMIQDASYVQVFMQEIMCDREKPDAALLFSHKPCEMQEW